MCYITSSSTQASSIFNGDSIRDSYQVPLHSNGGGGGDIICNGISSSTYYQGFAAQTHLGRKWHIMGNATACRSWEV